MLSIVRKTGIILLAVFILSILFPMHPLFAEDLPIPSLGEMTIITAPEGYVMVEVNAVNSKGELVGTVGRILEDEMLYDPVAFFWSATEGMKLIPPPTGMDITYAADINDKGEVVGYMADYSYEHLRAFYWSKDGKERDLLKVLGDVESDAMAINNQGHITGYRMKETGPMAYLLKDDGLIDLGSLIDGDLNFAVSFSADINNHDQIVGFSINENIEPLAFIWENMMMSEIGVCLDKEVSFAGGINDKKEVIGTCCNLNCFEEEGEISCYIEEYSAFLYTETEGIMDLGMLPGKSNAYPYGINNAGQVVGWSYNDYMDDEWGIIIDSAAFIWTRDAGLQDFGEMIGVSDIFSANDINDSGQVIGKGITTELGVYAFLWTPEKIEIEVEIDIKPGSKPNSINNNGHGVIPVAILASPDYDVHEIDPASLRLEEVMEIKRTGKKEKIMVHFEDVNLDGNDDLVAQFLNIEGAFPEDATTATLTGYLYDGTPIKGTDSIRIIH